MHGFKIIAGIRDSETDHINIQWNRKMKDREINDKIREGKAVVFTAEETTVKPPWWMRCSSRAVFSVQARKWMRE